MQGLTDIWNNIIIWFKNYFLNTVKNIGFVDVLDILILSFIFYFIYCFIRDRRAGKLASGLLIIMVLFVLSSASCTDHVTDHPLISWLSCTDHVVDHTLITRLIMH